MVTFYRSSSSQQVISNLKFVYLKIYNLTNNVYYNLFTGMVLTYFDRKIMLPPLHGVLCIF